PRSPCLRRHVSEMMDRINKRLRANMKSRGYEIIYRKFARGRQALLGRCANFRAESRRQRMKRHGTIHFLRALWHPLDSRLKDYDAKRVYEKTATRRACDTRQELHNAEWAAAPQRGAPVSAHQGTPGRDEGGGVGCEQRRSQ